MKGQSERRKKIVEDYYSNKIDGVEIFIDNVWDIHNVAAVLRSADGLGIKKVNLYYTYDVFPDLKRKGKNSSSSANKWIKLNRVNDLGKFAAEKKKEGFKFIAAELGKKSKNLIKFKFPKKCIIVLGNEAKGISSEVKKICDYSVFIPMVGMVQSYNISVAAALMMYEAFRQKGSKLKLKK